MEISEEAAWMSKRGGDDDERKEDEVAISIFLLLFCSLLIVLGPINLSGTNTCRKQSRGSHVTFTSGNLWLFFFVSLAQRQWRWKKRQWKVSSASFVPVTRKIFICTWGFHHFLRPISKPWKIKIFPCAFLSPRRVLAFHLNFHDEERKNYWVYFKVGNQLQFCVMVGESSVEALKILLNHRRSIRLRKS